MFKDVFFSSSSSTNLRDIIEFFYSTILECLIIITKEEVLQAVRRLALDKISSSNEIFNKLIKTSLETLTKLLTSLFQIYIEHAYYFKAFKTINTITLKKSNKSDYITFKTYRSIVLLNTLRKVIKSIMNKKIMFLTKIYRLLLDAQMNARKSRSTETILKLFTKQIHIVWDQSENKMIILLSMNVAKVFDTVSHERLIHNLRKRKISK
jgi:hypothetical protein